MNEAIQNHIRSKLLTLEKKHNIKILHAVESGSRAWGFASKDSDYDVRFIYVHHLNHYLSVDRKRDVIETPIQHDDFLSVDFDMSGWDVKKAIYLALRGNAVVNEWLTSPIQYISYNKYRDDLLAFSKKVNDLKSYYYFYRNYMKEPWDSYSKKHSEQIKIKHYCYVIRCALSLKWLEDQKTAPPMDMPSLLAGIKLENNLKQEIDHLLSEKENSVESDMMARRDILDAFIDGRITEKRQPPPKDEQEKRFIIEANALFQKIVLDAQDVHST